LIAGRDVSYAYATLPDSFENLTLMAPGQGRGNVLENVITGSGGNDQLFGFAGADHVIGGSGNDTLFGEGEGSDNGQVGLWDVAKGVGGVLITGEQPTAGNSGAGSSLAGLGDVNGDGHADIAIGSSGAALSVITRFDVLMFTYGDGLRGCSCRIQPWGSAPDPALAARQPPGMNKFSPATARKHRDPPRRQEAFAA
jgi:hypothetical protein